MNLNDNASATSSRAPSTDWAPDGADAPLVEILSYYAKAGFDGDAYAAEGGTVRCGSCEARLAPEQVDVLSLRRLEGASDPADMLGVLAVVCPVCATRSTLVLKYGPDASRDEISIWQRTRDDRTGDVLPADIAPGEDDPSVVPDVPPSPGDPR